MQSPLRQVMMRTTSRSRPTVMASTSIVRYITITNRPSSPDGAETLEQIKSQLSAIADMLAKVEARQKILDQERSIQRTPDTVAKKAVKIVSGESPEPVTTSKTQLKSPKAILVSQFPGGILQVYPELFCLVIPDVVSTRISPLWIRDHCRCHQCVQPSSKQRLIKSGDMWSEKGWKICSAEMTELDGSEGVRLLLEEHEGVLGGEAEAGKLDHTCFIPLCTLAKVFPKQKIYLDPSFKSVQTWDQSSLLTESPNLLVGYSDIMFSEQGLQATLSQVARYGLVIVKDVPHNRTSDEECELRKVMARIGEIRDTFYGQTWDVKAVKNSKNIAYTNVDLGFHQDLLYFENPPRFQALHCLRNKVQGGSSYFVDAYRAAEILHQESLDLHEILETNLISFEYENDGYFYSFDHPTIMPEKPLNRFDTEEKPRYHAINYSPPFQGTFSLPKSKKDNHHYDTSRAMKAFEDILARPELKYEFTMEEGDLVFFDNRRVLHARREFRDKPNTHSVKEGEATRWLKGCYMDGDVVYNKLRVLTKKAARGEIELTKDWETVWRKKGAFGSVVADDEGP